MANVADSVTTYGVSVGVGDIVLWKKGDGVFLKVTKLVPMVVGEDANGTPYTVPVADLRLHVPHPSEESCEMCR